jgi:putative ABC transport system permease protein
MGSIRLALCADLRVRWRAMAGLAVLLGLIGGVVLTAAAGARRTDTAYPRLLRWANAGQVDIISSRSTVLYQRLRRLPQVASVSVTGYYDTVLPGPHGRPTSTQIAAYAGLDGSAGITEDRVKVLSGHVFNPARPHGAMIDQQLARMLNLRPGGTLRLLVIPSAPGTGNPEPQRAVAMSFRVTAIVVLPNQIVPATRAGAEPTALLSTPFTRLPVARSANYGYQAGVRMRPGANRDAFVRAVTATAQGVLGPELSNGSGGFDLTDLSDHTALTERAITPQAFALAAFAALAGLMALAVITQLLGRQLTLDSAEFPILRALGMSRRALAGLSLARLAPLTSASAVLAVVVAIAASPLMPIGPARLAEPAPGIEVNLAVLGAGFVVIALAPLALVAPTAWRAAGRPYGPLGVAEPAGPARASRVGAALGMSGSVTGAIGVRMAFEPGRGRTAVPVRSALFGTIVAVAAMTAALVYGASLLHLIGTPRLYGQNWQQELDLQFGSVDRAVGGYLVAGQPGLSGYAGGNYGHISVGGQTVAGVGIDQVRGANFLTLLAGRPPQRPGEIALGAQTLHDIGGHLGQTVTVRVNRRQRPMRVVGVAVLPAFSQGTVVATNLGSGAVLPASVLSVPDQVTHCTGHGTCYNFFLVRYRPGTSMAAAAARLHKATVKLGCPLYVCQVTSDQRPSEIRDYVTVRDTPFALCIVLAMLAAGTLTHVLLTSLRRRRRDLAMLKTLGLLRGELLRVVFWQVAALAAMALLVGLPLGVLAGRWAWALFAGSVGVSPGPRRSSAPAVGRHSGDIPARHLYRGRSWLGRGPDQAGHGLACRMRPAPAMRATATGRTRRHVGCAR